MWDTEFFRDDCISRRPRMAINAPERVFNQLMISVENLKSAGSGRAMRFGLICQPQSEIPIQPHRPLEKAAFDLVQPLLYTPFMPVVHKFSASRVVMYAGDHLLAHVHVQLRDGRECTVELGSLMIVGRMTRREIREELNWIVSNRVWLYEQWRRLNP